MQYSYAGMHWPNGAEDFERIVQLPSDLILMLATEARWHYANVRNRGKIVIWRGLPRVGRRPAELGWNPDAVADECLNLWGEQSHGGMEFFQALNEQDLNYERGDNDNDYDNIPDRLAFLGDFQYKLGMKLRDRLPNVYLMLAPFTPDHGDIEHVDLWRGAVDQYNGLVVHAYENDHSSFDDVYNRLTWYCHQFPDKTIVCGEWNSESSAEEFLKVLSRIQQENANFMGATYFAWHWYGAPSFWKDSYNVDINEDLYNLFLNPPSYEKPTPPEPPMPTNKEYTPEEVLDVTKEVANEFGIPVRLLAALLYAESSLRWNAARYAFRNADGTYTNLTTRAESALERGDFSDFAGVLVEISNNGSNDVSFGVGQQTVRWADEGTHELTVDNVVYIRELYFNVPFATRKAAGQLAIYYRQYQDDLEALCRYNKPSLPGWQNPNRNNYNNALNKADELLDDSHPPVPPPGPPDESVVASWKDSNVVGNYNGMPRGVILHGSRSGVANNPKHSEFVGTSNWAANNPDGLGWTVTVGENEYCEHMQLTEWGWNARAASRNYLAVEFAQALESEDITDAQVHAFVVWMKNRVLQQWPDFPLYFPTHAEVEVSGETGVRDGKTDVFRYGSPKTEDLRSRIMEQLTKPEPPPDDGGLTVEEREELNHLRDVHGYVTHDIPAIVRDKILNKPLKNKPTKADLNQYIKDLKTEAEAIAEALEHQ